MKTVLCVPGHDEHKVKNCRKYGADLILFDLEDSVPEAMKDQARKVVVEHITAVDAIRINSINEPSAHGPRDLAAIDRIDHLKSVWLPKSNDWMLGWSFKHPVVFIVETPIAVMQLGTLLSTKRPIAGLAFGAADFAAYMNVPANSPQVEYARQQVALAAAALGVPAYDSPCVWLERRRDHPNSVYNEAYRAAMLGYGWKGAVHPSQLQEIKDVSLLTAAQDRELVQKYERQPEAVTTRLEWEGRRVVAPPMIRAAKKRLEEQR